MGAEPLVERRSHQSEPEARPFLWYGVRHRAAFTSARFRRFLRHLGLGLLGVAGGCVLVATFVLGRVTADVHPLEGLLNGLFGLGGGDDRSPLTVPETQVAEQAFASVVAAWNKYLVEHGGDRPADPYRVMLDIGAVKDVRELRWFDFLDDLPPRVNPSLAKNGKWAVFCRHRADLGEDWVSYADGTWARVKVPGPHVSLNSASALEHAGYPWRTWKTPEDRVRWLDENSGRLSWDQSSQMYLVHP